MNRILMGGMAALTLLGAYVASADVLVMDDGRRIRGDNYGRLLGYWTTEVGPLNQVVHLWEYASLNDRERLRGELAKNARWYLAGNFASVPNVTPVGEPGPMSTTGPTLSG